MRALITGTSGILGGDIQKALESNNWEVLGYNSDNIIIHSLSDVRTKVRDFNPDIIVHAAALTNVDVCEHEKERALLVNVIGTQNLAIVSDEEEAKMIYISSCGVYGNAKSTPYTELDVTAPLNYHHFTKLEGEKRVKEHSRNYLIIRPGWLFGGTSEHKKNFVEARRKESFDRPVLKSAADKFGSPTYTRHVALQIFKLIQEDLRGVFNVVNRGTASRYEYVSEILRLFNLDNTVEQVSSDLFPRSAQMPDNESLENLNLHLRGINLMPGWKEALAEYINEYYKV